MESSPTYVLTRLLLQRGLAFIYLIGFLIVVNQHRGLIGSRGLLPAELFVKRVGFWDSPSLFFWNVSDGFMMSLGVLGLLLSLLALSGVSEKFGIYFSVGVWLALWVLYMSFVNVGQTFYGFGWETLLLESGFLVMFLGDARTPPPTVVIYLFRWLAFRLMLGAGLIKIRGDQCWRDLTCMVYHYETQPLPNPVSWYLHQLPVWVHQMGVAFTHFVELAVPFGLLAWGRWRVAAGVLTIFFQAMLIMSGNLSWLNYITIVITFACFDDAFLERLTHLFGFSGSSVTVPLGSLGSVHAIAVVLLAGLVGILSIRPVMNMVSPGQMMNASFEPLHLVNTYGAFGSITRERYEVIIEGTDDLKITAATVWKPYEFNGKPGATRRRPSIVSPYHWKLDWQMWFAAMSGYQNHPWIVNLVAKLLKGEKTVVSLFDQNPFAENPPRFVRAELYLYKFADAEARSNGEWWRRNRVGEYLPPLSLDNPQFLQVLRQQGWE